MSAGASAWLLDPDNAALLILVMVVSLAGASGVRFVRSWTYQARGRAREHEEEIDSATAAALAAERTAFAREIHDIVSHAVGLIACRHRPPRSAGRVTRPPPSRPSASSWRPRSGSSGSS